MHFPYIILLQPGDAPVILLSLEKVTQGEHLSMVLYGITLVPPGEELRDVYLTLLSHFYANDVAFDGSERRSAAQLQLLMHQGPERGYFPDPTKSLFIADNLEEKEAANQEFKQTGLHLNYVNGSLYLGDNSGPRGELEA